MGKTLAVISISLLIIVIVVLFPKVSYNDSDSTIEACNCIGIEHENKCFGLTFECSVIGKTNLKKPQPTRDGVDLTLLLDKSKSMEGPPLMEAKKAASELVDLMDKNDRLALISFDKEAKLLHEFTNNKEDLKLTIENIHAGEDTYYLPALKRALENYQKNSQSRDKKIIFISDGLPTESE